VRDTNNGDIGKQKAYDDLPSNDAVAMALDVAFCFFDRAGRGEGFGYPSPGLLSDLVG
jgi:hypothetical protein